MKREDLENRLQSFSLNVLSLVKTLPRSDENRIYGHQVIRSSSSIGANYAEAICGHSRQDFLHSINICRKETNETVYWLKLITEVNPVFKERVEFLLDESKQLLRIFMSSVKTAKQNQNVKNLK